MRIELAQRKCTRDLSLATRIGNKIFYVHRNEVFVKSVAEFNCSKKMRVSFAGEVSAVTSHRGNLVLVFGNVARTYLVGMDELTQVHEFSLPDVPVQISSSDTTLIFLYRENKIQIKDKTFHDVVVTFDPKPRDFCEIVCVFHANCKAYFLTTKGSVFETPSFCERRTVILCTPLKILPESAEVYNSIVVCGKLVFLSRRDQYAVYEKHNSILVLKYTYSGSEISLEKHNRNVFCIGNGLLRINDSPELICDGRVDRLFGNMAVFRDKVVFVENHDEDLVASSSSVVLLHESDAERRSERLLGTLLRFDLSQAVQHAPQDFEEAAKKVVGDLRMAYSDAYVELKTLEESFKEKERVLDTKYKELVRSVGEIDAQKSQIVKKQAILAKEVENMWNSICFDTDTSEVTAKIMEVTEAIRQMQPARSEKYIRILRVQRSILRNRVFGR